MSANQQQSQASFNYNDSPEVSPNRDHLDDDWNEYSDEDLEYQNPQYPEPGANSREVNSTSKDNSEINYNRERPRYDNRNDGYKKPYRKGNERNQLHQTSDYNYKKPSYKQHDKKYEKYDKYEKKGHYNDGKNYEDRSRKNYRDNNFSSNNYTKEVDDYNNNSSWKKPGDDHFAKKSYSENFEYKGKKGHHQYKDSGFKKNFNDRQWEDQTNTYNTYNNNTHYMKNKPSNGKTFTTVEKHFTFTSNENTSLSEKLTPVANNDEVSREAFKPSLSNFNAPTRIFNEQNSSSTDTKKKEITFSEKRIFTNTKLTQNDNSQDKVPEPETKPQTAEPNPIPARETKEVIDFNKLQISEAPQQEQPPQQVKHFRSTPNQNKFNNSEVNVSPMIQRNLEPSVNMSQFSLNQPKPEESAREKSLSLNSTSYFPSSKWKDKSSDSNFNKYDYQNQVPSQVMPQYESNMNTYYNYQQYPQQGSAMNMSNYYQQPQLNYNPQQQVYSNRMNQPMTGVVPQQYDGYNQQSYYNNANIMTKQPIPNQIPNNMYFNNNNMGLINK